MNFNNIGSPQRSFRSSPFKPGKWLWVFTIFFLPLFIFLGVWQLNRANEKDQMQADFGKPVQLVDINWSSPPVYAQTIVSGQAIKGIQLLLDNKTYQGQVGYEVFQLHQTQVGVLAVSMGWVAGSANRQQLPTLVLPESLVAQTVTIRPAPTNPLFGVEANIAHEANPGTWVVQSLTLDWLSEQVQQPVLGFVQLNDAQAFGVGPVVWQASVMSATKHRGYAVQWFGMATALFMMFLYAGFRGEKQRAN